MEGRDVRVTAEDAKKIAFAEESKNLRSRSIGERWSEAMEREEIERELAARQQRKKAIAELSILGRQRNTSSAPTTHVVGNVNVSSQGAPSSAGEVVYQPIAVHVEGSAGLESVAPAASDQVIDVETSGIATEISVTGVESCDCVQAVGSQQPSIVEAVKAVAAIVNNQPSGGLLSSSCELRVEMWWLGPVDLDLSCVMLDFEKKRCGLFFFGESSSHGAFAHSGDMLSAPPPRGASERISVRIPEVPPAVDYIYFVMTAFNAESCGLVENLLVRVVDGPTAQTLIGGSSTIATNVRAALLCRLRRSRENSKFIVEVLNDTFTYGDTVLSLTRDIERHAQGA